MNNRLLYENIGEDKYFQKSSLKLHIICFLILESTKRIYCYFRWVFFFFFRLRATHAVTSSFEYYPLRVSSSTETFSLELVM